MVVATKESVSKKNRRLGKRIGTLKHPGTLPMRRYWTRKGQNVYDSVKWTIGDVSIDDPVSGEIFKQKDVELPSSYSELAKKVIAQKYFYGELNTPEREYSGRQLFGRVVNTIAQQGVNHGYFDENTGEVVKDNLLFLCLNQYGAFNSPVWFNVGKNAKEEPSKKKYGWIISDKNREVTLETDLGSAVFKIKKGDAIPIPKGHYNESPQSSACFIQSIEDTMESIMQLGVSEAMLFKHGSGTGTDLSPLRSFREKLSGGGKPSGPLGYLKQHDTGAAVIRSGGKTRRAAKMNSLKDNHPDIKEFIEVKSIEEQKIRILYAAGLSYEHARDTVDYQNTNLSIRISDAFMKAVENNEDWQTFPIHNLDVKMPSYNARELFRSICRGTHICGDPGIQFHDTINRWHTCPESGPINASNPCSEYMFIDDSSCNLASHRLTKYQRADGSFDVLNFTKAVEVFIIGQDILYQFSSFPEKKIAENSYRFRPLGMGFADLGAFLMREGIQYDSNEARTIASSIASLMTATGYEASAKIAQKIGAFEEFEKNREPMLNVIGMHEQATENIDSTHLPEKYQEIKKEASKRWKNAIRLGKKYGFRNAQTTVLAPTGTISFLMDCDTTGIEPDIALVKYKKLAGGGLLKIVNQSVGPALKKLGYDEGQITDIEKYIGGYKTCRGAPYLKEGHYELFNQSEDKKREETLENLDYDKTQIENILLFIDGHDTIEGAPHIKQEHLPVFDCSFKPRKGKRSILPMGHVKMMAAVQPFLSGAISKTVNMNRESSVDEIEAVYKQAYKLGLKAIAIYRDGTKRGQPVTTGGLEGELWTHKPVRRRLPETRKSITHKFSVAAHEGYLTVGLYEDRTPGELFITMAKEGSTVGGLMDVIGTCTSMALQYGVPLTALANKFRHMRFEPAGMTSNKKIPFAKSLVDYIFTWMEWKFIEGSKPNDLPKELENAPLTLENANINKKESMKDDGSRQEGKVCFNCATIFEATHCGDVCPNCNTPDFSGCEGGVVR